MPNPYNNKVQLADGTVLIDLSTDTLSSADQLMQGVVAHDRTGAVITGTLVDGNELGYGTPSSNVVGLAIVGVSVLGGGSMVGIGTAGSAIVGG